MSQGAYPVLTPLVAGEIGATMVILRSKGWLESTALKAVPVLRRIRPGGARLPRTGPAVSAHEPGGKSAPRRSMVAWCRLCRAPPAADAAQAAPPSALQRSAAIKQRRQPRDHAKRQRQ